MVAPTVASISATVIQVVDTDVAGTPGHDAVAQVRAPLSVVLSDEVDGALASLQVSVDVLLLAALGRAVERTLGAAGVLAVDIADGAYSGGMAALRCASAREVDASTMLLEAAHALTPTSADGTEVLPAAVALAPAGTAPVELTAVRALQVSAHRRNGVLQLDWWYDSRRFDRYTVEELAEQFPLALIELTSEAVAPLDNSDKAPATDWVCAG